MADTDAYQRSPSDADYGVGFSDTTLPVETRYPTAITALRTVTPPTLVEMRAITYVMRAWDSGGGGRWVIWTAFSEPNNTPFASQTFPNYTGTLSKIHIAGTF